jgi:hypothetical protein
MSNTSLIADIKKTTKTCNKAIIIINEQRESYDSLLMEYSDVINLFLEKLYSKGMTYSEIQGMFNDDYPIMQSLKIQVKKLNVVTKTEKRYLLDDADDINTGQPKRSRNNFHK